jgi:hypothetical protein
MSPRRPTENDLVTGKQQQTGTDPEGKKAWPGTDIGNIGKLRTGVCDISAKHRKA